MDSAVYANGNPIIIYEDGGSTYVKTAPGYPAYDSKTFGLAIDGYAIFGGSEDNSYGAGWMAEMTLITLQSGTVGNIYGGNRGIPSSGEAVLNTVITITGGNADTVYGGNMDGTLNNSMLHIVYTNGAVNAIYGGSDTGDILNSYLSVTTNNVANTATSKIGIIYGGSDHGHIFESGAGNSEINVNVRNSIIPTVYGGSKAGNITGNISVSAIDSNISLFHGGSKGAFQSGGTGVVHFGHTGNIYGNINSHFQNTSGNVAFGASEYGEVFGNVVFHLNACPICDEGEKDVAPHICLNSTPGIVHTYNTVIGGGGDNIGATRYPEINYANVYGDTKLVVAGETRIDYRLMGGGRQGNVRKVLDGLGNPTEDGGNVTLIVKGKTYFYWSCAAGYYSYKGLVAEGNVNTILGGNTDSYQYNGGGEFGGVGGEITTIIKENAKSYTVYGGTSTHYWWNNYNAPDETTDTKATVIVENGTIDYLLSNQKGYLRNFEVIINNGTILALYGGGGFDHSHTENTTIYLNGGNISYVFSGGNDFSTVLINKSTVYVGPNIGKDPGSTIPIIYGGGAQAGSRTGSVEIIIDGAHLNDVFGGGFGYTNSSSVIIKNGSEVTKLRAGGPSGSEVNNAGIEMINGTVNTLYGGGYNSTVNNSTINASGGEIDVLYLGGYHNIANPTDVSNVVNSVLKLSGTAITGGKIYGTGEMETDTVDEVFIHLHDLKTKDYWYYFDEDSLSNAELRIIRYGQLLRYGIVEVDDSSRPIYLFPYTLFEKDPGNNTSTSSGGGKTINPSSPMGGVEETPEGFKTEVETPIIIVLLFPLAIASYCYRRKEDKD
ncbi:hypothetical protein [Methanimicrococcus stummii]|nr:hypothetical protein [Methanimicrococcus sp. Es2]